MKRRRTLMYFQALSRRQRARAPDPVSAFGKVAQRVDADRIEQLLLSLVDVLGILLITPISTLAGALKTPRSLSVWA